MTKSFLLLCWQTKKRSRQKNTFYGTCVWSLCNFTSVILWSSHSSLSIEPSHYTTFWKKKKTKVVIYLFLVVCVCVRVLFLLLPPHLQTSLADWNCFIIPRESVKSPGIDKLITHHRLFVWEEIECRHFLGDRFVRSSFLPARGSKSADAWGAQGRKKTEWGSEEREAGWSVCLLKWKLAFFDGEDLR